MKHTIQEVEKMLMDNIEKKKQGLTLLLDINPDEPALYKNFQELETIRDNLKLMFEELGA